MAKYSDHQTVARSPTFQLMKMSEQLHPRNSAFAWSACSISTQSSNPTWKFTGEVCLNTDIAERHIYKHTCTHAHKHCKYGWQDGLSVPCICNPSFSAMRGETDKGHLAAQRLGSLEGKARQRTKSRYRSTAEAGLEAVFCPPHTHHTF